MTRLNRISPENRRKSLRNLLSQKGFIRAIEAHNGMISVDSKKGEGTTFTISMPTKRD